jgi:hypothetical protein
MGMTQLCIGITNLSPGWQSILESLGVWFEAVDFTLPLDRHYSAIIVNAPATGLEIRTLQKFQQSGAGLLITKNAGSLFKTTQVKTVKIPQLPIEYARFTQFVDEEKQRSIHLAIHADKKISDHRYERKRFYFKPGLHPDELVSVINKGALLETIEICLRELHLTCGLPFIKKWNSPQIKPVFAFRVDSDFGTKASIGQLYNMAKHHRIPMTWFLHIQAHEGWLKYFHNFENQEIALHGYEHGTSESYEQVLNNIERGKQLLVDAGFTPVGFCVPYGIWNNTLGRVLQKFDFSYTSEFTIGYDAPPFYPIQDQEQLESLQIPIHPICTGSLSRKKASVTQMETYFLEVLHSKVIQNQPVIFYHHPMQPGLEIWNAVFKEVNNLELTKLTFAEFAAFWKLRNSSEFKPVFDAERKEIHCSSSNPDLLVSISVNRNSHHILKAKKTNEPLTAQTRFEIQETEDRSPEEYAELTEKPLQLIKTSILDWKNRKRL